MAKVVRFMTRRPRIAYLFSRYPVISQTFCDTEILALERQGMEIEIDSIHPPHTSFRHGHASLIHAPIYYAPHPAVLKSGEKVAKEEGRWPTALIARHEKEFGESFKPALRARNALHFAKTMSLRGVAHIHVHFANRAAYTARFIKEISGIPYSFTAHAQDFMVDLSHDGVLRELCAEAAFVVTVSDYTQKLLAEKCPDSAAKIHRVYNGIDLTRFTHGVAPQSSIPTILSIGRLVEFKGFHHLIRACGELRRRGIVFRCEIVGDGPERENLEKLIAGEQLQEIVSLTGVLTQEEIARRLSSCAVFALASDIDSKGASDVLPTVILEAMAAGRPVVSTRVAGIPELVAHEESGALVERGDVAGFSKALFRLLADHELRMRYGAAGRMKLEKTFRVEDTAGELRQHFERHAGGNAKPPATAANFAYILDKWPAEPASVSDRELTRLVAMNPAPRLFVCRPGLPFKPKSDLLANRLDFIPDAMVLEADWRHSPDLARSAEALREELGNEIGTEEFLLLARYAAHLIPRLRRLGLRHVHAPGGRAALTAWIIKRLTAIPYSTSLEPDETVPKECARMLAEESVGGLTTSAELAKTDSRFHLVTPLVTRKGGLLGLLPGQVKEHEPDDTQLDQWFGRLADWASPA